MVYLFDVSPKYDPHVVSIINYMLEHLKNNNPKSDSSVYAKNAAYIKELYDGTFLIHPFNFSNENQYNLENAEYHVRRCKGSWGVTRKIIMESLEHLEQAKGKDYMPFNKKFVESITFGNFFEGNMRFSKDGSLDSNFMKFINEPKRSVTYNTSLAIDKIKRDMPKSILEPAEKFAKKYFKMKTMELAFWNNMEDWNRWIKAFKKNWLKLSSEFFLACDDGNMFTDYSNYLIKKLTKRSGEKAVVNAFHFKMTMGDSQVLGGIFRDWISDGIKSGKFAVLSGLPKSIDNYYTDESFSRTEKVEKVVIDADEIPIF